VIEVWDSVLSLPIIGVVDTRRSLDMTERLLEAIVRHQARCVIIDVTGVEMVDTATADHFVKMIKAAEMLGTTCVVSGISPAVAQTLTRIGVELTGRAPSPVMPGQAGPRKETER
jgi:rsbT co-antagonist protein RsbR